MIEADTSAQTMLLPCPFCGASAHMADTGNLWVVCDDCTAEGPGGDSEQDAINAWNTRSTAPVTRTPDAVLTALDRLVKRLESIHEHPAYQSVWTINQIHCGPYSGPTYVAELNEAKRILALSAPQAQDTLLLRAEEALKRQDGIKPNIDALAADLVTAGESEYAQAQDTSAVPVPPKDASLPSTESKP